MATAMDRYAPFDTGAGANVTENTWRDMMSVLRPVAIAWLVGDELLVFGDSTGMQVKVKTGQVWARGHWGAVDTQKTLAIAAAHATLGRIDRVVARFHFVNNSVELDVLTGTPSASPSAVAATSNSSMEEVTLASVTVDAAASTIAAAKVVDLRERWGVRTSIHKYRQNAAQSIPNGSHQRILWHLAVDSNADLTTATVSSGTEFTCARKGWWRIDARLRYLNNATSAHHELIIATDATTIRPAVSGIVTTGSPSYFTSDTRAMAVGDKVSVWGWQNTGAGLDTEYAAQECSVSFTFLGL